MARTKDIFSSPPGGFQLPAIHPGKSLEGELAARRLSAHALALKLRVPANRISEIIAGKRGISPETALRLGRYFGTGAAFWANLQSQYDLAVTERQLGDRISAEVDAA
jgi:addiction module HigA family antidote